MNREAGARERLHGTDWRFVALLTGAVALWIFTHPYEGIRHDARLYMLQALAQVRPDTVGGDIFLSGASQARYTLFSVFHGLTLDLLGIDAGTRLLWLLGQAWWFGAVSLLAVRLLGRDLGALALMVVASMPGQYADLEWRYAEGFLTARLWAEAAVLSALAAAAANRRWSCAAFILAAFALHPLMAAPGALVAASWLSGRRGAAGLLGLAVAGTVAAIALSRVHAVWPIAPLDADWLALIQQRVPVLMLSNWGLDAWDNLLRLIVLLAMAAGVAWHASARLLFVVATVAGLIGLGIAWLGAERFPVALIVQGQGWRWLWIAAVVAALALAVVVPELWRRRGLARSALLLLLAGACLGGVPGLALSMVALAAWWFSDAELSASLAKNLELAGWVIAGLGLLFWVQATPMGVSSPLLDSDWPVKGHKWIGASNPVLMLATAFAAWGCLRGIGDSRLAVGAAAVLVGLAAAITWAALIRPSYPVDRISAFSAWRDRIPASAEVLWAEDPAASWALLDRRHYVSFDQTAGAAFDRETTFRLSDRAEAVRLITSPRAVFSGAAASGWPVTGPVLHDTCSRALELGFVVTQRQTGLPEAAPAVMLKGRKPGLRHLYDCAEIRAPFAGAITAPADTPK